LATRPAGGCSCRGHYLLVSIGLSGGVATAVADSPRFLRVATFNLWNGNGRIDEVARFLATTDADVVVLLEVSREGAHGWTGPAK